MEQVVTEVSKEESEHPHFVTEETRAVLEVAEESDNIGNPLLPPQPEENHLIDVAAEPGLDANGRNGPAAAWK